MSGPINKSSRRAFLTQGAAALGAGTAAASAPVLAATDAVPPKGTLRRKLGELGGREAIRQLNLTFMALMESGRYGEVVELFHDDGYLDLSGVTARGKAAIRHLLCHRYPLQEVPVLHRAYRQSPAQQQEDLVVMRGGQTATGTFHVEVERCAPLEADSTVANMARLQGLMAESHWESGRFEAIHLKASGGWKIQSWIYRS